MISATAIRVGNVLILDGELFKILKATHVTPGKGVACMQIKMRNLRSGVQSEKRFNSTEKVERAFMDNRAMEYLYEQDGAYHFMDAETYEQLTLTSDDLGDAVKFLLPNQKVQVEMHDSTPIGVALPKSVELKVTYTEPTVKRPSQSGSYKKATLETGIEIQVPNFVDVGDAVKVDTESGDYLERV